MAFNFSRLARLPLAYYCAVFFGLAIMMLILAAPHWQLDRAVRASRVYHVLHFAKPPVQVFARVLLALIAGLGTALLIAGRPLLAALRSRTAPATRFKVPQRRVAAERAEPGRNSASRRPIFADKELGAPLMSAEVLERAQANDAPPASKWDPAPVAALAPAEAPIIEAPHVEPQRESAPRSEITTPAMDAPAIETHASAPGFPKYSWLEPEEVPVTEPVALHHDVPPEEVPEAPIVYQAEPLPIAHQEEPSLQEMIARLEAGLANRTPRPPQPPIAYPAPIVAAPSPLRPSPIAPPLAVVPQSAPPAAPAPDEASNAVQDRLRAMRNRMSGSA